MDKNIRQATPDDLPAVRALLAQNNLPPLPNDFSSGHVWLAEERDQLIGAIALELTDGPALVRSAVVDESRRGSRVGETLVRRLVSEARVKGVKELYLLTETASGFFARLGFDAVARADVPSAIQATEEYRVQCPDSAKVMHLKIGNQ